MLLFIWKCSILDICNFIYLIQNIFRSGYVIVEKSFKVYAYTSSPFQCALLGMFTNFHYRLPNMIAGIITRESVYKAFKNRIHSKEIIHYLEQHAHLAMRANNQMGCVVPENVSHQIEMWEAELNRWHEQAAYMLEFRDHEVFQQLLEFSKMLKIILWVDETKRLLVVKEAGYPALKKMREDAQALLT